MAAAPPPPFTFDLLFGTAGLWDTPTPDYLTLANLFAHSATSLIGNDCRDQLVQLSSHSPIVLAFVSTAEPDTIYVAHSVSIFPANPVAPTTIDGHMMAIVGNDPNSCTPVVFGPISFTVTTSAPALDVATILGVTGHGTAHPVLRSGPHAAGTPNTNALRTRPAILLPPADASDYLSADPSGSYTFPGFYNLFLAGPLASPPCRCCRHSTRCHLVASRFD